MRKKPLQEKIVSQLSANDVTHAVSLDTNKHNFVEDYEEFLRHVFNFLTML
jgi:hypothetical protein